MSFVHSQAFPFKLQCSTERFAWISDGLMHIHFRSQRLLLFLNDFQNVSLTLSYWGWQLRVRHFYSLPLFFYSNRKLVFSAYLLNKEKPLKARFCLLILGGVIKYVYKEKEARLSSDRWANRARKKGIRDIELITSASFKILAEHN